MRAILQMLIAGVLLATAPVALAADSAVFLMYHRFGEDAYPSTNVRIEQFEAHVAELTSGKYNVMPVGEILGALRSGKSLPDRTIGITIDDAYLSVYKEAWPRLKAAGTRSVKCGMPASRSAPTPPATCIWSRPPKT
jgi:hypothetical protein